MEKQVSLQVLPWQPALTTPPLVVLLLYLQNAQLSFKPALCLQEPGRQGGGRIKDGRGEQEWRGGRDWEWGGGGGGVGGGTGGLGQLRARRFLCILWYCRSSNIYSTNCLMRLDALLCADEGQISKTPSKDDVCFGELWLRGSPSSGSATWQRGERLRFVNSL